jgi:cytochrome P450
MTLWTPTDDGNADLSSHDSFVDGAPHATFARLRRDDPMAWCHWAGGKGFWSVTRYADILALNRDHGITVLMVTHEPDMAAYARRVVTFVDGRIASDRANDHPATAAPDPAPQAAGSGAL